MLNQRFWDLFSNDYRGNCLAWNHAPGNPVIPAGTRDWKSRWTANPDVIDVKGRRLLYYRGNGTLRNSETELHDHLGVAEILDVGTEHLSIDYLNDDEPIVDVGLRGDFDGLEVLDPSTIVFTERVFLYYSAIGAGPDAIGLAVSDDGISFEKVGKILDGRAPEAVEKDGQVHLLYQVQRGNGYEFHVATSVDGRHFNTTADSVFSGEAGSWDGQSVVTPAISRDGDTYYMFYAGSSYSLDEPDHFGLARSTDLRSWERHPGNPIFGCGPAGSEDGGAIWFPTVMDEDDFFVILYEGSRGRYSWDLSSQICMASIHK